MCLCLSPCFCLSLSPSMSVSLSLVTIKIIKNQEHFARQARVEISILQLLNQHDPDGARHIGVCVCWGRSIFLSLSHSQNPDLFKALWRPVISFDSMEIISKTH